MSTWRQFYISLCLKKVHHFSFSDYSVSCFLTDFYRAASNAKCTRGLAMRKLSVRLSLCLPNAWIVIIRKKDLSRFLYHTKDHLA